jgi:hypothetical protein
MGHARMVVVGRLAVQAARSADMCSAQESPPEFGSAAITLVVVVQSDVFGSAHTHQAATSCLGYHPSSIVMLQ